jgi:DNA-directed RNA polymerase specialized sigma24 family protein
VPENLAHPPATPARAAELSDQELLIAMRSRDPHAWAEWDLRFRAFLESYAHQIGIPRWDAGAYVSEVLLRAGLKLSESRHVPRVSAYLCAALRNQSVDQRRLAKRRARHHAEAAAFSPDGVVRSLVSEATLRASEGAGGEDSAPLAVTAMTRWLEGKLSDEELLLLSWIAEHVPRRTIASWLGVNYETAKKRCLRLSRSVRELALSYVRGAPREDRAAFRVLFARAGIVLTTLEDE